MAVATVTGAIAAVTDVASTKRSLLKRGACSANTLGAGPVASPDTAAGFLAYSAFSGNATGAATPAGYSAVAINAVGSASSPTYLTYKTMTSYDVAGCAAFCESMAACNSFNIFYVSPTPTLTPPRHAS